MRWCFIRNEFFRALKGKWPILILALVGLILLLVGGGNASSGEGASEYDYMTEAEEYRRRIESDVTELCSKIKGVGGVSAVMVTLESGDRYVWAENVGSGGSTDLVISNKSGILVERQMPKVRGVTVVCVGGGNVSVRLELTKAISSALGISSGRIHVSAAE